MSENSQITSTTPSISLLVAETREVLHCPHCNLVQFRTRNGMCRRCHNPLVVEEPCVSPEPDPAEAEAAPEEGGSGIVRQLGRRVRAFRRMRGLSQYDLATRMHVPRTYLSKVENCRAVPNLTSLSRIASALGIGLNHLLSDSWIERCELEAIVQDPFLRKMAQLVNHLDSQQRAVILRATRQAAKQTLKALPSLGNASGKKAALVTGPPLSDELLMAGGVCCLRSSAMVTTKGQR